MRRTPVVYIPWPCRHSLGETRIGSIENRSGRRIIYNTVAIRVLRYRDNIF